MVYYRQGECAMKIFDKYFQPYAEYCLRTTLSEEELKEALAQECPATSDVLSWKAIKAAMGLSKTIVFSCNPDNPLHLHPIKAYRNTSSGDLFIRCETALSGETVLHITIAQNKKYKRLLYGIDIFALLFGIAASFITWWGIFFPLFFIGFGFIVLECCHAMAMDEVPQIRQDFEIMLRAVEKKKK